MSCAVSLINDDLYSLNSSRPLFAVEMLRGNMKSLANWSNLECYLCFEIYSLYVAFVLRQHDENRSKFQKMRHKICLSVFCVEIQMNVFQQQCLKPHCWNVLAMFKTNTSKTSDILDSGKIYKYDKDNVTFGIKMDKNAYFTELLQIISVFSYNTIIYILSKWIFIIQEMELLENENLLPHNSHFKLYGEHNKFFKSVGEYLPQKKTMVCIFRKNRLFPSR